MLDRIGKLEGKVEVLTSRLEGVEDWVQESRSFHKDMNSFVSSFNAIQAEREKQDMRRHRSNSNKLNFILALCAVVTVVITLVSLYVATTVSHEKSLAIPIKTGMSVSPKTFALERAPQQLAKE